MIKVKEEKVHLKGTVAEILSEFGVLTAHLLKRYDFPNDLIFKTIKLSFDLSNSNILDLITTDLEMTEEFKAEVERQKKELEEKGEWFKKWN